MFAGHYYNDNILVRFVFFFYSFADRFKSGWFAGLTGSSSLLRFGLAGRLGKTRLD